MKKILGNLVLVVILMLTLSACSRNLSTPSSRLVGHWETSGDPKEELFISKVGSKTGEGSLTIYVPRDGSVTIGNYKIFTEEPDGNEVAITVKTPIGTEYIIDFVLDF